MILFASPSIKISLSIAEGAETHQSARQVRNLHVILAVHLNIEDPIKGTIKIYHLK